MQASGLVHPYIRISGLFPMDISAYPGMALAICGSNGTGKTTFLKLLLKEIEPKKGTVQIDAQFAYLGIKNGFKPQLTVQQQLPYFMSDQLDFPWPEFLHTVYKGLSTGQQRLVALWLTLHSSKPLILLDEPFAHLDSLGCSQAYMWINTQLNLKKTIIFTHQCPEGLKDIQSLQIFDLNGY
jgi:ABC-type multidrug transport system ATPase subunit